MATFAVPMLTGVVGLGRYSNECFLLAIAAAVPASRLHPKIERTAVALSAVPFLAATIAIAAHGLVP